MITETTRQTLIAEGLSFEQIQSLEAGMIEAENGVGTPAREFHAHFRKEALAQYA